MKWRVSCEYFLLTGQFAAPLDIMIPLSQFNSRFEVNWFITIWARVSDTTFVLISEEGIDCHTTYVITLDSTSLREMFSGIDSSGLGRGLSSRGVMPNAAERSN